jgi:hypothetical protein
VLRLIAGLAEEFAQQPALFEGIEMHASASVCVDLRRHVFSAAC